MDSQEPPQQQPLNMMVGPTSYPSMMAPATARFPFNNNPPPEPFNDNDANNINNTCEALKPCGLASESAKKKRGRPRKYSPDGNIALGLAPTNASSSSAEPTKKHRGRPPGSGKKQMDALGIGGTGFTPHVILAESGEDIAAKLMSFCQQGPRTVCILSASGAICNVTIRQPAISGAGAGGTVSYEAPSLAASLLFNSLHMMSFSLQGRFEIISLSGSMQQYENNSGHNRMSGLSVTLAGSDGRVLGGEVSGALTAASPVQVIVGSFITDGKKSSSSKSVPSSTPSSQMLTFGAPTTPTTPPTSQGPSTESSDENENSHFSKGPGGPGLYNNASQQPIHTMPMYHHQLWAGQTQQEVGTMGPRKGRVNGSIQTENVAFLSWKPT
ncbi:AT-hook motif nuclear-localized protein 13, partial [Mucuna pruriens]